jgi:peroxiredoxin
MKSKLCTLILVILTGVGNAQNGAVNAQNGVANAQTDTTHGMLYPDSQTVFLNETGDTIKRDDFMNTLMAGGYTMVPTIGDGRIKMLKLRANGVTLTEGNTPPDFSVSDLNGKVYHLKDLKGKVVVLNFWFTHCVGCIAEMPELNQLHQKYLTDSSVVFLAITFDDLSKVQDFLKTHAFSYPIAYDQGDVIKQYGLSTYPFSMVVDKENKIVFSNNALLQGKVVDTLSKYIDASIAGSAHN